MRRYDGPVETRMGLVSGMEGPEQFLWRGRLWKVRAVLAHWVETGPWWQSGGARAVIGSDEPDRGSSGSRPGGADLLAERELWRVEAGRGPGRPVNADRGALVADPPADGGGVFDLAFDWNDGRWALVGCVD